MCCEELRERRLYWRLYLCTLRWIIHKTLVEATRESHSKETVSNEKDSNLKQLVSLSSSPPLPPSLPLSSSLSQDLSPFFFCLGHSVLFLERSWSTACLKSESPRSAVMERAKLCFYLTKTFRERRTKSIIAELRRCFFYLFRYSFKPASKPCRALALLFESPLLGCGPQNRATRGQAWNPKDYHTITMMPQSRRSSHARRRTWAELEHTRNIVGTGT